MEKKIVEPDDYIGEANEVLERFLMSMQGDNRFIKEHSDDDEETVFIYTKRGMVLAEKMIKRLIRLGEKLFPDYDDFHEEIESYLFEYL